MSTTSSNAAATAIDEDAHGQEASALLGASPDPENDTQAKAVGYGTLTQPEATDTDLEANETPLAALKPPASTKYSSAFIARTVAALLVAVFANNADASLVMATHTTIASSLGDLQNSSWLFISFGLAGAATQTLFGKLSDIYGRRSILLASYGMFAVGCAFIGLGQTMWEVILGRLISGSGGAGMTVLAAVIITGEFPPGALLPSWQSYMNVIATIGRSIGGPLGGLLADTIGWRWSFLGQVPIFLAAILFCWLTVPPTTPNKSDHKNTKSLARIDFLGALLLACSILALLIPLELGGQKLPWTHPLIFGLFGLGIVLMLAFVCAEQYLAKEPILPLRLFRNRDVTMTYVMYCGQCAAQVGMMFSVPMYFQITQDASATEAGAHLFPAVVGNTIGGIITGLWIKKTGHYKGLLLVGAAASFVSYTLLLWRWHGHTNWWESLYIVPGGFGTGVSLSAGFIALQAVIEPADKAVASSVLYMQLPIGSIIGVALSSAATLSGMRTALTQKLLHLGFESDVTKQIVERAASDMEYAKNAPETIATAIRASYVQGLAYGHLVSLAAVLVAFMAGSLIRERRLR
ncbi:major facilitator superfamily domain-containing protein [Microdochium trichocladiopsis]|uniref:Major facilitator superfamily domain-containing protein n=1 Tax=Microdochium trichocladiopsis TaxID=1682393 RepID=A0A9P8Y7P0_9PEZI|nr:major facilitator superfamily domain-containing protein [Microdochium trichocladiopsis]KAH7033705.1 major facilitator superfamily domain-containing protein [Microdochium trichocladiopsis]